MESEPTGTELRRQKLRVNTLKEMAEEYILHGNEKGVKAVNKLIAVENSKMKILMEKLQKHYRK